MGPTQPRYHEAIQKKVEDQEVKIAPEAPKAQIIDLVLEASLAAKGEGQAEPRATTESDDPATGTEG